MRQTDTGTKDRQGDTKQYFTIRLSSNLEVELLFKTKRAIHYTRADITILKALAVMT